MYASVILGIYGIFSLYRQDYEQRKQENLGGSGASVQ